MAQFNVNINLNLAELPACPCGGSLLPVEDTTQQGVSYLKGWVCPKCNTATIFKAGDLIKLDVIQPIKAR